MSARNLVTQLDNLTDAIDPDEIASAQLRLIACRVFTLSAALRDEFRLESDADVDDFVDECDEDDDEEDDDEEDDDEEDDEEDDDEEDDDGGPA